MPETYEGMTRKQLDDELLRRAKQKNDDTAVMAWIRSSHLSDNSIRSILRRLDASDDHRRQVSAISR